MKEYVRLLRPKHYIKNILIPLPLVFSGRLLEPALLRMAVLGVLAFCLLASIIYIINDIHDVAQDRQHPTKCHRPIASGAVSVRQAYITALILLAALIVLGLYSHFPPIGWGCLALYLAINIGYSRGLKNIPILDVVLLISGFLLRVLFGSVITGIEISGWFYLTVTSAFFYMGLGKRRNELLRQSDTSRKVLQYYNEAFLSRNMQMCLGLAIVFYSLWSVDASTHPDTGVRMMWTVPLIICICLKYSLTIEGDSDGDPVEVICKDKVLLAMIALCGLVILGLLYL